MQRINLVGKMIAIIVQRLRRYGDHKNRVILTWHCDSCTIFGPDH